MFFQPEEPDINIVSEMGEVTLCFDGKQVVQGWETEMLSLAANMVCEYGGNILEVGLGLGISAQKIANHQAILNHTIVEKYKKVIDLFYSNHPGNVLPKSSKIVHADVFEFIEKVQPGSLDGIFYDPFFPAIDMYEAPEVVDNLFPKMFKALRSGGALIPFPSLRPIIKEKYFPFSSKFIIVKYRFTTYENTTYMQNLHQGNAFIKAIIKD